MYDDFVFGDNFQIPFISTDRKDVVLNTLPHYTDIRFKEAQSVFGEEVENISYDYSDRLAQWDFKKHERAIKAANDSGLSPRTCLWYEKYLSVYFDREIEIHHILAGWNWATGYSYQVFGYSTR